MDRGFDSGADGRADSGFDDDEDAGWTPSASVRQTGGGGGRGREPARARRGPDTDARGLSGPRPTGTGPRSTGTGPRTTGTGPRPTGTGPRPTGTGPRPRLREPEPDLDDNDGDEGRGSTRGRGAGRPSWVGPILVAAAISVVAVGLYVILGRGGGGGGKPASRSGTPSAAVTAPAAGGPGAAPTPSTTQPEAAAGKALVDGAYRCYQGPRSTFRPIKDVLVVPRGLGAGYTWNGTRGTYTIAPEAGGSKTETFSTITFASGPLQGVKATFLDRVKQGTGGKDQGGLIFQDNTDRYCGVN
jgi:integrin beta 3